MLCKLFQQCMCLYEACKYYDMAMNGCTYDLDSKKKVLAKAYVASIHSARKEEEEKTVSDNNRKHTLKQEGE